jgi:hypothetical protein
MKLSTTEVVDNVVNYSESLIQPTSSSIRSNRVTSEMAVPQATEGVVDLLVPETSWFQMGLQNTESKNHPLY